MLRAVHVCDSNTGSFRPFAHSKMKAALYICIFKAISNSQEAGHMLSRPREGTW